MRTASPHIVVLGAGFGGLTFCQNFNFPTARITLVDRQNHHLFQPLLYQVATAGLSAPDIAQPVRSILSDRPNITVLMDHIVDIQLANKTVVLENCLFQEELCADPERRSADCRSAVSQVGNLRNSRLPIGATGQSTAAGNTLTYDYLVLALGAVTSYFGHPEWEQFAPGLKSLNDAIRIRRQVLLAFEKAENASDPAERDRLMTLVVIGGGPTGLELAGAFAELAQTVLAGDFRRIDPRKARVILIEAAPRVLGHFPPELSASAEQQLRNLGVEVRTASPVKSIRQFCVELEHETIRAENIIWAAGVSATPLTTKLEIELDRAGRVKVNADLSVPGHPEVFAIGDLALVVGKDGKPVPGVSPAAMQMAKHVAKIVSNELSWPGPKKPDRPAFEYWDKGTMATIGRSAAVAEVGKLQLTGYPAWLAWLVIHLVFLVGFRNKVSVLLHWAYSYFTYKRGSRIITGL